MSEDKVLKQIYKICPNCGNFKVLNEKDTFCNICGKKYLLDCPKCHEVIIYPILTLCPVCGEKYFDKKK